VISATDLVSRQIWCIVLGMILPLSMAPLNVPAATLPPITAISFTPDGNAVVVGSQAGVEVRTWPELRRTATLPTELANVHDLAFSPDVKVLAIAGGEPAAEGTVELYRWPERDLIRRVNPHDDVVYAVAWSGDSQEVALTSGDQRISLLTVASDSPPRYLEGHSRAVLTAAFLAQEGILISAGVDASIRLWDTTANSTRRSLANHTRAVNDLKVRPSRGDNELPMIATASDDRTVRFWQPTIGRLVRFARLESAPLALAWSPDGTLLWAACRDGHVRAVDPDSAAVESEWPAIDGVAYTLALTPDGSILVGGSNGQLRSIPNRQSDSARNAKHIKNSRERAPSRSDGRARRRRDRPLDAERARLLSSGL
jgi:WD40 repeat protein